MTCGDWRGDSLLLRVRAVPRASRVELAELREGRLLLRLTAAPAEGAANDQARRLLARAFGVSPSRVVLKSGLRHRNKLFEVQAPTRAPAATMVSPAGAGL